MSNLQQQLSSRLSWPFWPEKEFTDVYENIYVRTFTEDWFNIMNGAVSHMSGGGAILDVGCGEGHTTKQILDRVEGEYVCDLLEPSGKALESAKKFLEFENKVGDMYEGTLKDLSTDKRYDLIFTSHTNYYWADDETDYKEQLDKFVDLTKEGGKSLMLTLPADSDQYKVLMFDPYKPFVRSEYMIDYYQGSGRTVEVTDFTMRMYVGDFFTTNSLFDVKNFYCFLHGTEDLPSDEESIAFRTKIDSVRNGDYLNFKDQLLIISN